LQLTEDVIKLNAANYTAWFYRRLVLSSLKADLYKEIEYVSRVAEENPKNYQLWHHRRVIVERLNDPSKDLEFTAQMFLDDAKNYHVWSHRQWVIEAFNLWENELEYVESLLTQDFRNNSVWNQRYFVISRTEKFTPAVIEREIKFTFDYIKKSLNNPSSWNYLKGILKGVKFDQYPNIEETCRSYLQRAPTCVNARSLLVDILQQRGTAQDLNEAIQCCEDLITYESSQQNIGLIVKTSLRKLQDNAKNSVFRVSFSI